MGPQIDFVLGLLVGYAEAFGYLDRIILGMNTALLWEDKAMMKKCKEQTGFQSAQGEQGVGFVQAAAPRQ